MGALAVDMQLDFWTAPEPEPAARPALAPVVRDAPGGGERTLEDWVLGAWEELAAHRNVDCPLCGGEMVPSVAATGAVPAGAAAGVVSAGAAAGVMSAGAAARVVPAGAAAGVMSAGAGAAGSASAARVVSAEATRGGIQAAACRDCGTELS